MENNKKYNSSNNQSIMQFQNSLFSSNINSLDKYNLIHYKGYTISRISFLANNNYIIPNIINNEFIQKKSPIGFISSNKNKIFSNLKNNNKNLDKQNLFFDLNKVKINKNNFFEKISLQKILNENIEQIKDSIKFNKSIINNNIFYNINQFNQNSIKNSDVRNDIKSSGLPKESPVIKKEINNDKIKPFFNTIKTNNKIKENISSSINSRLTENKSNVKVSEIININQNKEENKVLILGKKRGRKRINNNKKVHLGSAEDNIQRKIHVHFISFITKFTNDIIQTFIKSKDVPLFRNIDYKLKKTVSLKYFKKIKKLSIGEILQMRPSPKMKIHHNLVNVDIYNKICNIIPFIKDYFQQDYVSLFKEYYYNKDKIFVINGKIISVSNKTRTYSDLVKKNYSYKEKFKFIALTYFLDIDTKPDLFKTEIETNCESTADNK